MSPAARLAVLLLLALWAAGGARASGVRVLPPSGAPQVWPEPLPIAPAPLVRAFLEVCVAHVDALERVYAGRFDRGLERTIPGGHARTDEAVLLVETGGARLPLELAVSATREEGGEWRIHDRFCRSPGLAAPSAEVIAALRDSVFLPGYRTFQDDVGGFRYAGWGWRGATDDFLLFVGEALADPGFRFLIARWNSPPSMTAQPDIEAAASADRACPLCQAQDAKALPRISREGWRIVECAACGFVYLRNPPGHAALSEEFAWEKGLDAEKDRRLKTAPAMYGVDYATRFRTGLFQRTDMQKYLAWFGGGNVLDIGCAQGDRIQPPFTPFGIEISRALAEQADAEMRARGGRCLHGPGAEAIWGFEPDLFDGIVMRSYLEHEEEPLKVLRGARRALKPTGAVYVKVPNYGSVNRRVTGRNWCGIRLPDHVNYFTPSSLKAMAAKAGFEMQIKNPLNLMFDDNIHALLRKQGA